jgi:hypothetical protein
MNHSGSGEEAFSLKMEMIVGGSGRKEAAGGRKGRGNKAQLRRKSFVG